MSSRNSFVVASSRPHPRPRPWAQTLNAILDGTFHQLLWIHKTLLLWYHSDTGKLNRSRPNTAIDLWLIVVNPSWYHNSFWSRQSSHVEPRLWSTSFDYYFPVILLPNDPGSSTFFCQSPFQPIQTLYVGSLPTSFLIRRFVGIPHLTEPFRYVIMSTFNRQLSYLTHFTNSRSTLTPHRSMLWWLLSLQLVIWKRSLWQHTTSFVESSVDLNFNSFILRVIWTDYPSSLFSHKILHIH